MHYLFSFFKREHKPLSFTRQWFLLLMVLPTYATAQKIDTAVGHRFNTSGTHRHDHVASVAAPHGRAVYRATTQLEVSGFRYTGPAYGIVSKHDEDGKKLWTWKNTTNMTTYKGGFFPYSLTVDKDQNPIVVGQFSMSGSSDQVGFGGKNYNYQGGVVIKLDSSGKHKWHLVASNYAQFNDVETDVYGNVYVLGNTQSQTKVGPYTITPSVSNSWLDFLVKLSPTGKVMWVKKLGEIDLRKTSLRNEGAQINLVVDKSKSPKIYTCGFFIDTYTVGNKTFRTTGYEDALALKYDSSGALIDSLHPIGSTKDIFYTIDVNSSGQMAMAVCSYGSVTFHNNTPNRIATTRVTGGSGPEGHVISLNDTFGINWIQPYGLLSTWCLTAIDEWGRIAASHFAIRGTKVPYLRFYEKDGTLAFTKNVTVPLQSTARLGLRQPTFSAKRSDKLFVLSSFTANTTLDSITLKPNSSGVADLGFIRLSVPTPCDVKFDLGRDSAFCQKVRDTLTLPHKLPSHAVFKWWDGDSTSKTKPVDTSGKFWLTVSTDLCSVADTTYRYADTSKPVDVLPADTLMCNYVKYSLKPSLGSARQFEWIDKHPKLNRFINKPGTFVLRLENLCGTHFDTFKIDRLIEPYIQLRSDTILCNGDSVLVKLPQNDGTYTWNGNALDNTTSKWISKEGLYKVNLANACGDHTDSFGVATFMAPQENLGPDTVLCNGNALTLQANTLRAEYYWNNVKTTADTFRIQHSGTYTLEARNPCGIAFDTLKVDTARSPIFSYQFDSTYCEGDSAFLQAKSTNAAVDWWMNSQPLGSSVWTKVPGSYLLTAQNACGTTRSIINIKEKPLPVVSFAKDTMTLGSGPLTLAPTIVASLVYWSTGDSTSTLSITKPGVYTVYGKNECGVVKDSVHVVKSVSWPYALGNVIEAFPNPTWGKLHLVSPGNLQFSIVNAQGQTLMTFETQRGTQVIDVSQLPPGWYVLVAHGPNANSLKPFKLGIQSR